PQIAYAQLDQQSSEYSSPEVGLVVPVFQKGDDPIDAINHMMSFLTSVVASRYPATNNQLRTSSNPRQQATINNGRVTIQPIQGRQNFVSAGSSRPFTSGQALWVKRALIDYDVRLDDVLIMCDNKGAIDLSKNPMQHSRTKRIEIRYHFLRDYVQKGHIPIEKVLSIDNVDEILMKPLKRESLNCLRLGLGMMEHMS
nr:retrovirus-related Pol polyprotein from transposon TNT 1-94 [Tanacetum cinerariifolium]